MLAVCYTVQWCTASLQNEYSSGSNCLLVLPCPFTCCMCYFLPGITLVCCSGFRLTQFRVCSCDLSGSLVTTHPGNYLHNYVGKHTHSVHSNFSWDCFLQFVRMDSVVHTVFCLAKYVTVIEFWRASFLTISEHGCCDRVWEFTWASVRITIIPNNIIDIVRCVLGESTISICIVWSLKIK